MDLLESAKFSGFIPEIDRKAFIDRLTEAPPSTPAVVGPHPQEERLQGDLFLHFPLPFMQGAQNVVIRPQACMIVSNTCDLQPDRSDRCTVAVAADYSKYETWAVTHRGGESARGHLEAARSNKIDGLFFLESSAHFPSGTVIFLDHLISVPSDIFEAAISTGKRVASLSSFGFYFFLIKLTRLFARAESAEVQRTNS